MFVTRLRRLAPPALASLCLFVASSSAEATATWQEMHETSDDVRLEIAPNGVATVQHHLRYRIVAGHFRTFEIAGLDPHVELAAEAVFKPEKTGSEVPARIETGKVPGTARIVIDEGKGLGRGPYTVDLGYKLDLVGNRMLSRDGAMWKVAWTAPPATEGHDGARVVFDLPTAPTEPRLAGAAESTTTLATLRRSAERDELELVRAHVPRGEAVVWSARLDPKALPAITTPELRPPAAAEIVAPTILRSNLSRVLGAIGFALLAAGLALVLREKQRSVRAVCEARAFAARPALPFGAVTPFVYGITATLSLAVLLWWLPVVGALLVVLAMALAAHRAPLPIAKKRTPGVWRPLTELLPKRKTPFDDAFDLGARRGRVALGLLVVAVVLLVFVLRPYVPQIALALPLFASTLLPLFVTGTRAQMAEDATDLAARVLRPIRDALGSAVDLSHVEVAAIGRLPEGAGLPDDIRLTCAPKERTPGLRAIEVALATTATGGAVPEVLVRFDSGSAAADRVAKMAPLLPGRTAEERVMRLRPEEPTAPSTSTLVARLLGQLEERRAKEGRWKGADRRRKHAPTLHARACDA